MSLDAFRWKLDARVVHEGVEIAYAAPAMAKYTIEAFQWSEWRLVVEHDLQDAAAVRALNVGQPDGAAKDLALVFPVFHFDETKKQVYTHGRPNGDAIAVGRDCAKLAALSKTRPTWRFHMSTTQPLWSWKNGIIVKADWREGLAELAKEVAKADAKPAADKPPAD
jgi:hypothetical protein